MKFLGFVHEVSARQAAPDEGLKCARKAFYVRKLPHNTKNHGRMVGGGLANLSINDVCDVTGGQQRHPDKLKHVRQVGLALLSVVFDPV